MGVIALSAVSASASKMITDGNVDASSLYLGCTGVDPQGEFVLNVWPFAFDGASDSSTVELEVVSGAEFVDGKKQWRVRGHRSFPVRFRRVGTELVRIDGTLRIPRGEPSSYDLVRATRSFKTEGSEQLEMYHRVHQRIGVRGKFRFRYGGYYRVAIEKDETENPVIDTRPVRIKGATTAPCRDCGLTAPGEIQAVLTVKRDGSVTWVRPRYRMLEAKGKAWEAAEKEFLRYRYKPARSGDRAVPDYAEVSILVTPSR